MATAAIAYNLASVRTFTPSAPESLDEANLSATAVESLILKKLYLDGEVVGRELSRSIGLKFSVISDRISFLRQQRLIAVKRSLGMGDVSSVFCLSELGIEHAKAAMEKNKYSGAAPVSLDQYADSVAAQKQPPHWLTPGALRHAYRGLVVTDRVLNQIGPAVNAGKSLLIYGQPGNGKTFLAEALLKIESSDIFIPYAIDYQGQIVRVYDPMYHTRVVDEPCVSSVAYEEPYDGRWVRCKRPFIITGGELTLSTLDLSFNAHTKTHDAPFQMKANNGIYLIDDFGRQQVSPSELLNRWIIPMERRIDYLSLSGGGKMTVPFETFLVFSTNLTPSTLGDEAFLRRIQYKLHLRNPDAEEFTRIFLQHAAKLELQVSPEVITRLIEREYQFGGRKLRRCHPRDLLLHAADHIAFHDLPRDVTDEVLTEAVESCFGDSGDSAHLE